jgi:4-diphosphocytidyl-2-C-methyl-D-erythritol kinase
VAREPGDGSAIAGPESRRGAPWSSRAPIVAGPESRRGAPWPSRASIVAGVVALVGPATWPRRAQANVAEVFGFGSRQAGLGGASADAAATLLGLTRLWDLNLDREALAPLALALGADVPFFLLGGTARAQGVGEILTELSWFPRLYWVIAKPDEGLSTPAVFKTYHEVPPPPKGDMETFLEAMKMGDWERAAPAMANDLEAAAISLCPHIGEIQKQVESVGALRALMTGSGTSVIGWFADQKQAERAAAQLSQAGIHAWPVCSMSRAMEEIWV